MSIFTKYRNLKYFLIVEKHYEILRSFKEVFNEPINNEMLPSAQRQMVLNYLLPLSHTSTKHLINTYGLTNSTKFLETFNKLMAIGKNANSVYNTFAMNQYGLRSEINSISDDLLKIIETKKVNIL
jgi:hypothetical protein